FGRSAKKHVSRKKRHIDDRLMPTVVANASNQREEIRDAPGRQIGGNDFLLAASGSQEKPLSRSRFGKQFLLRRDRWRFAANHVILRAHRALAATDRIDLTAEMPSPWFVGAFVLKMRAAQNQEKPAEAGVNYTHPPRD